ncbi:hypothetical protein [Bacillus cereus]|uniref:hypothetical protein n=1 Tax=Bacillus cereus TaxID=1396 RepID=UPI000BFA09B2|nr:hypothetical protein [Bacillus cereus]KAA1804025.1 hypothetical protein FXB61_005123 [Bacillus cereus]PEZ20341.1 hypothetical protein CN365_12510 [Bacillus cereus]
MAKFFKPVFDELTIDHGSDILLEENHMIININADRVREQLNYDESLMVSEFPLFKLPEDLINELTTLGKQAIPHTTHSNVKGWFKMRPDFGSDVANYAFQMLSGYDVFDGKEMKWKCIEKAFGGLETKHKVLQRATYVIVLKDVTEVVN